MTFARSLNRRAIAGVVLLAQCAWGCSIGPESHRRVEEIALRASAVRMIPPTYPRRSVAGRTEGVAVADLELTRDGAVRGVTILESPDSEIARELTTVLKQWRFSLTSEEGPLADLPVRGKLTYYFVLEGQDGVVLTPLEKARRMERTAR